jgi:RNA polymerase sigma-32 factor
MRELISYDPLKAFLRDIEKYTVLSREEEYKLAVKYREEGDLESAKRLVVSNLRFVTKIASEYASYGFALLDLIQEGTMGLMTAIKKFNPERGYRLISYAVWWIRARIHDFIMKSWSLVKIGTTHAQRKLFQKLSRAKKQLNISDDDLSEENLKRVADLFDVKEKDVLGMEMRMSGRDFSLDVASSDDETITYLDSIPDHCLNQEEIIESVEMNELTHEGLQNGLSILSPKEQYVIEKRYFSIRRFKLRELGDELGVSKERVRQIEVEALKKLRKAIENRANRGYPMVDNRIYT